MINYALGHWALILMLIREKVKKIKFGVLSKLSHPWRKSD